MLHRLCVAMGIVLVLCGYVLPGVGRAEVSVPPEEPVNDCHDVASWRAWEALVAQNPTSHALHALHALRLGLCLKVERQDLTVEQATAMFETARQALLMQLRGPRSGDRPLYARRGGLSGAGASSTDSSIAANIERGF